MGRSVKTLLWFFLATCVSTLPIQLAKAAQNGQDQPQDQQQDQQADQNQGKSSKAKQKSLKDLYKELNSQYKKWLNEDVVYIITPEERRSFLQLQTNEEREQFIEAFWQRRNPDPDSPENTFKEEHYRRIAYANEHFASGIPGWKTDRAKSTSCGDRRMKSTRTRPGEPGTVPWIRVAARQRHIPTKIGAIGTWKAMAKTWSWSSWIRRPRVSIT